jgi:VanZ family protein
LAFGPSFVVYTTGPHKQQPHATATEFPLPWIVLAALTALLSWLSLTPAPPKIDHGLLGWDKFQHALAYAFLTLVAGRAFRRLTISPGRAWLAAATYAALVGGGLEVLQGLSRTGRFADWSDLLADLLGILTVLILVSFGRLWSSRP